MQRLRHHRHLRSAPHRTAQAISNLIGNAGQHGSANAPIAVSLVKDHGRLVVEVHNAGEIPADNLFLAFQGKEAHSSSRGLGLGLYIASVIAKAHGGGISVASTAEGGTTFTMLIRRAQPLRAVS